MRSDGWIKASERKPTAADADVCNCVIAWHRYDGAMVTGYRQFEHNGLFTHWMRCPEPPEDYPAEYRALWDKK